MTGCWLWGIGKVSVARDLAQSVRSLQFLSPSHASQKWMLGHLTCNSESHLAIQEWVNGTQGVGRTTFLVIFCPNSQSGSLSPTICRARPVLMPWGSD
jgi:hypothetical protein